MRKLLVLILAVSILQACGSKKSDSGAPSTDANGSKTVAGTGAPAASAAATGASSAGSMGQAPGAQSAITQSPIAEGVDQVPLNYDPSQFSGFEDSQVGKRFTGAQNGDDLFYTSSSTDSVLAYLRSRNSTVSEVQKQANLQAAAQIFSADLQKEPMVDVAYISLKVQEGADVKNYTLVGELSSESMRPVKLIKAKSTGHQILSGQMKCIDFDGGCNNILARLSFGAPGSMAIAYVVFRNSIADLFIEFSEKASESKNPEFIKIWEMFSSTIHNENTKERFDNYNMKSFEVVNGRSGFKIEALAKNDQFLGFSGPLLAPEVGSSVKIPVSRLAQNEDLSLDLLNLGSIQYDLLSTLGDLKLINNNGLGQIRLQIKMRKFGMAPLDAFNMTFMRRIQPTIDAGDELLK